MYNVPNGSKVDSIHGRITTPKGRILSLTKCPYPRLVSPKAVYSMKPMKAEAQPLTTDGGMMDFREDGLAPLSYLYVEYAAPSAPSVTSSNLEDYMWSGLQDANADSVIQPVAGWGYAATQYHGTSTPNNSGLYLDAAAYYYWSGNAVAASFIGFNAGDTLEAGASASGCDSNGANCTWFAWIADVNTGQESQFSVTSSPSYTTIIGGELESYNAIHCNMLFANHNIAWRHLALDDIYGNVVTPNFWTQTFGTQQCSMGTASAGPTGGNIFWTP